MLDPDPAPPRLRVVHRNGDWSAKMPFVDVIRLASRDTVARLLERDDFATRIASNAPVGLHELFYPIVQGYGSVAIEADVELGGTDQKSNQHVGRALQESFGQAPPVVTRLPLLPGLDGVQGKSLGNHIGVTDAPDGMFGKVMSIPDAPTGSTGGSSPRYPTADLGEIDGELGNRAHP